MARRKFIGLDGKLVKQDMGASHHYIRMPLVRGTADPHVAKAGDRDFQLARVEFGYHVYEELPPIG